MRCLAIMMSLNDTCLLHRGGLVALNTAQAGAAAILAAGGTTTIQGWKLLQQLDRDLIALNASPGGSADLLAATLFLDFVARARLTANRFVDITTNYHAARFLTIAANMEKLHLEYPASQPIKQRAHVGVVGSGDLEVLLEPSSDQKAHVRVSTSVDGFGKTWQLVLDRFFSRYQVRGLDRDP